MSTRLSIGAEFHEIRGTESAAQIRSLSDDCDRLGEGVTRVTYALSHSLVLKVQHSSGTGTGGNREEFALWDRLTDEEKATGTFAAIYAAADDYSWLICERAESIGYGTPDEENRALLRKFGVSDQHSDNYGSRADGTYVCVDYGYSDLLQESEWNGSQGIGTSAYGGCNCGDCDRESSYCGCGGCDCEACNPEGCQCAPFSGCNATLCSACCDRQAQRRAELHEQENIGASWRGVQVMRTGQVPVWDHGKRGRVRPLCQLPTLARMRLRFSELRSLQAAKTERQFTGRHETSACTHRVCHDCAAKLDHENAAEMDTDQTEQLNLFGSTSYGFVWDLIGKGSADVRIWDEGSDFYALLYVPPAAIADPMRWVCQPVALWVPRGRSLWEFGQVLVRFADGRITSFSLAYVQGFDIVRGI